MPIQGLNLSLTFALRLFVPGFTISYLYVRPFLPQIWGSTGSLSKVGITLIIGFIFYLIGIGYYAKHYFPTYSCSWKPLFEFLEELIGDMNGVDENNIEINKDFIYRFHTLFWLDLERSQQQDLRFYYSFYLFSVFLFSIFLIYAPFRIVGIYLGLIEYTGIYSELTISISLFALCLFLYFDGRRSLKSYHNYFTYLGRKKEDQSKKIIELMIEGKYDELEVTPFA